MKFQDTFKTHSIQISGHIQNLSYICNKAISKWKERQGILSNSSTLGQILRNTARKLPLVPQNKGQFLFKIWVQIRNLRLSGMASFPTNGSSSLLIEVHPLHYLKQNKYYLKQNKYTFLSLCQIDVYIKVVDEFLENFTHSFLLSEKQASLKGRK